MREGNGLKEESISDFLFHCFISVNSTKSNKAIAFFFSNLWRKCQKNQKAKTYC